MTTQSGKRAATAGLLVLVFGAGGLVGFVVGHRSGDEGWESQREAVRERSEQGSRRPGGIVHQLDLTETQRVQVDSILEHHRRMWAEVQREVVPRHREIVQRTRNAIREVLTPDQEAAYDSLLSEAADRRRRGDRRGGGDRRY